MRRFSLVLGVLLSLAMIGVAFADTTVTLNALNNSGISGTAQLIAKGNQTEVIITETGEPSGASEPAHIHVGQCGPTLGAVKYPLHNVEGGKSDTLVNASLQALQNGNFAINVHQSAANIGTYVACGNIPAVAATTNATVTSLPKTGGAPVGLALLAGGLVLGAGYLVRRRAS